MTMTAMAALRRIRLVAAASDRSVAAEILALTRRTAVPDASVRDGARAIVEAVRLGGVAAVRAANARFGGGLADGRLILRASDLDTAKDALPAGIRRAIEVAIENVTRYHGPQLPVSTTVETVPGVSIERRWSPLASVGAYVPGGGAPYPSTLVMTVVPARIAGVPALIVATPAGRDGTVDPVILGAAGLLGVDAVFVAGGAQAVAALAFGLADEGLPAVDRIVGPGNAWVTAAKLELAGEVGIDLPAGPSEGMVLAEPPADPDRVAADLLTQAEHGPDSPALLVTTDPAFADAVEVALRARLALAPRRDVLERALATHGRVVIAADRVAAIEFVNAYGPEHLSIDVEPLEPAVAAIRNAGSIFAGPWAPESAGDYATGANHVLPTGGLARASGALDVAAYGKYSQVQRVSEAGLRALQPTIVALAEAEGLFAHRDAVTARFLSGDRG